MTISSWEFCRKMCFEASWDILGISRFQFGGESIWESFYDLWEGDMG